MRNVVSSMQYAVGRKDSRRDLPPAACRLPAVDRGYTLLEMIVAVGIFSVVMLTATGAFLTLISLDREARLTTSVVTNLSFAVDSMARAVRTGTNYDCDPSTGALDNCSSGGDSLQFLDTDGRTVTYSVTEGQIIATVVSGTTISAPLTDPRVTIEDLRFYVLGVGTSEGAGQRLEPRVLFTIYGTMMTPQGQPVDFTIQGGATQRVLDLPSP